MLMPDGTVFATGATHTGQSTGHTAIYTPGSGWKAVPIFPTVIRQAMISRRCFPTATRLSKPTAARSTSGTARI